MDASVSFEQSLEHCLQALARTGDVEASLGRYPQYADELRPLLEMAQVTRRYYRDVPQAPGRLAAGRQRTLAVAAQGRARRGPAAPGGRTVPARGHKVRLVFATRSVAFLLVALQP